MTSYISSVNSTCSTDAPSTGASALVQGLKKSAHLPGGPSASNADFLKLLTDAAGSTTTDKPAISTNTTGVR